jgi:hypothetical protein
MGDANIFMDKSICPFIGVDLTTFLGKDGDLTACLCYWGWYSFGVYVGGIFHQA